MSLTVLTQVLPKCIVEAGVRGRTRRNNTRTQNQGGHVQINSNWVNSLREYEVGFIAMGIAAWAQLEGVFEATLGGAYGFLLEDPKDKDCTHANGVVLLDGSDWRVHKRYSFGANNSDRKITRPRTGAVIKVNGVVDPAASVNTSTGVVQFGSPDPHPGDTITWAGSFYVPVHFADDQLDWELVRAGDFDDRLVHGPTALLREVRE